MFNSRWDYFLPLFSLDHYNNNSDDVFCVCQVAAENNRDRLSIILAGYEDDMETKLYSYNSGI